MEPADSGPQQVVLPPSPSGDNLAESPPSAVSVGDGTEGSASSSAGPMRKRLRRNPAVLIRWIEDHPFNPYPTKGEKQGLAFYAGMTLRQLNDWFANARRNIKKVGYENWKKKHNGFSAILSGIPLANNNSCGLSVLSAATSVSNGGGAGGHGLNSSFANHPFTNTAFTIAPLNRSAGFSASAAAAPCSVMSYPSPNGPMACVKPTPLPSPASFVKVEGGGAYYGGGYSLAHTATAGENGAAGNSGLSSCSSAASSSFCLSSLPFSHESYQLAAAGHTQTAAGPLLAAAVDGNIRPFSTPTTAATIPYIACDQCTPSGSAGTTSAVSHHPTVFYNWAAAHQPVPMGSTTVLNHAGFAAGGLMAPQTPSPPPPQSQCADAGAAEQCGNSQTAASGGDSLQSAQDHENTSSPHESGYYSGAASPAPNHHTR